jgi:serine/threonine protein kinase
MACFGLGNQCFCMQYFGLGVLAVALRGADIYLCTCSPRASHASYGSDVLIMLCEVALTGALPVPQVLGVGDGAKEYSPAVDMWSVGVILFILLSGYSPFGASSWEGGKVLELRGGDG